MTELENIPQQEQFKVLLIGESCKDIYHYGVCDRLCAEAPVPVFDYRAEEVRPGMAANVRENLLAYGLDVDFVTNDPDQLIKRRFVDTKSNQLLLREDLGHQVDPVEIPDCKKYDAVVISDYCKGILDLETISVLCETFTPEKEIIRHSQLELVNRIKQNINFVYGQIKKNSKLKIKIYKHSLSKMIMDLMI